MQTLNHIQLSSGSILTQLFIASLEQRGLSLAELVVSGGICCCGAPEQWRMESFVLSLLGMGGRAMPRGRKGGTLDL